MQISAPSERACSVTDCVVCCVMNRPAFRPLPERTLVPGGWKLGTRHCLPGPMRSALPMRFSASRRTGQFSGS